MRRRRNGLVPAVQHEFTISMPGPVVIGPTGGTSWNVSRSGRCLDLSRCAQILPCVCRERLRAWRAGDCSSRCCGHPLSLSFVLPALILLTALRLAGIEKPSDFERRVRKVAFISAAAPIILFFSVSCLHLWKSRSGRRVVGGHVDRRYRQLSDARKCKPENQRWPARFVALRGSARSTRLPRPC